jgi:hypothetical protein
MKHFRIKAVMSGVLCTCLAPVSRADDLTKETHVSINGPLEVRDIVLLPGEYVFRLTEPFLDHSLVSIYNAQTNRLEATIIGVPAYRLAADDKRSLTVSQPKGGEPAQLQTWFYPGDSFGVQFQRQTKGIKAVSAIKSNRQAPDTGSAGDGSSRH